MRHQRGFTLVELLVVIAIIGVLVALLLPAVQMARESARMAQCLNNLKQIGIAMHNHHDTLGSMPPGWTTASTPEGDPGWGWTVHLLPFMEQNTLKEQIDMNLPIGDLRHANARTTVLSTMICPTDVKARVFDLRGGADHDHEHEPEEEEEHHAHDLDDEGTILFKVSKANYAGAFGTIEIEEAPSAGDGTFFHNSRMRFADLTDGLSNTIIVGERASRHGRSLWIGAVPGANASPARVVAVADHGPNDPHHHFEDFSSFHVSGANFLLGDGSARRIGNQVNLDTFRALVTRAGGESFGPND